ncbi:ABC transporter permease [Paraburkholderia sp.]|uniref:ABC transporter permease n=1 Tax=Paraburkholderia sp. TaxID=1926495 RepID=UPI0039E705FE
MEAAISVTGAVPRRRRAGSLWLLLPAFVLLAGAFIGPLAVLLSRSVLDPDFTLRHYARIFSTPAYLRVIWISIEIALVSTAICLAAGYPTAYVLSRMRGTARTALLGMVLLPFWTNILVRVYAWIVVLQSRGAINLLLMDTLGIIDHPLKLVFNYTGAIIGMVHYLMPPTILILDSTMRSVDQRLVLAAQSLGATPRRAFFRVFVPLTLPGIRAAAVLIFIMGLGFFVTPALLGGRQQLTMSMLINQDFTEIMDWSFGSALAVVLLALTLAGLYVYYRLQRKAGARPNGGLHV